MNESFFAPSGAVTEVDAAAPVAAPAAPNTQAPDSKPASGSAPDDGVAGEISRAEAQITNVLAPGGGVADVTRDANGRFVSKNADGTAEDPDATKPGADYAKADPDAQANTAGKAKQTGEKTEGADATETWRTAFSKNFGVPIEHVDEASQTIANDFSRVMSDFQAGKFNQPAEAAQTSTPAAAPVAKPAAPAPAASTAADIYSDEDMAAIDENFDERSAKLIKSLANKVNELSRVGDPKQVVQQAVEEATKRVNSVEQARAQAKYDAEVVSPFFVEEGKSHPELAVAYGSTKPNQVQMAARRAVVESAAIYQAVKRSQNVVVTDQQAMSAAIRGFHEELYEKQARSDERRQKNTGNRHRIRDIGATPGQGNRNSTGGDRLSLARRFIEGSFGQG